MTHHPSAVTLLVAEVVGSIAAAVVAFSEDGDRAGHGRALRELRRSCAALWALLPRLTLLADDDAILWNGEAVLEASGDASGFLSLLLDADIRELTLDPGVEAGELARLVGILARKRRTTDEAETDLPTLLFRAELDHVRYRVEAVSAEPVPTRPLPTAPLRESSEAAAVRREAVRQEAESPRSERSIVRLEKFDSTLYFLDQNEIEYLRTSIDREYAQDHARNVLELLLDVLEQRSEPDVRDEVIEILTTLLPYLLGTGRFEATAYLTGEIRRLARALELQPQQAEALAELRTDVSETRALAQLFHALDAGDVQPDALGLGALLRELSSDALRTVLIWAGQLRSQEAKSAIAGAVEGFFTESPGTLARMTDAPDRTVVHRALGIARALKLPEFAEPVRPALASEDPTTRKLAVRALGTIGTSTAMRAALGVIDDPDAEVRRAVFEALKARPFRSAKRWLDRVIASADLEEREVSERRILFEAFGAVAGPEGVSELEPILEGRGSFGRRPSSETRACAAVALGVIGTQAARLALDRVTGDRDPVVRSAAASALRREARP